MGPKPNDPTPPAPPAKGEHQPAPSTPAEGAPSAGADPAAPRKKNDVHPDPTRYGDWERKGRCIDF